MAIVPEQVIINENVLDIIGKNFKFDHAKGITEWLKNSVDAYNNSDFNDSDQIMIISLKIGANDYIKKISVLDFHGMSKVKIDTAFKDWFSPDAAGLTNNLTKAANKTFGGHGNGGKFYMRQMFATSNAITYYKGRFNIFGFDKNKMYGFDNKATDIDITPTEAIGRANLDEFNLSQEFIDKILNNKNGFGFTLIEGSNPIKSPGTNHKNKFISKLYGQPQAQRLINKKKIYIKLDGSAEIKQLQTKTIEPKIGFENPYEYSCNDTIELMGDKIDMVNKNYPNPPKLILYTSKEPLKGHTDQLNRIDIEGEVGVIASYKIEEIGKYSSSFTDFIYGECFVPIMEDGDIDCVENDRDKLTDSPHSRALKFWIRECIEELSQKMQDAEKDVKKKNALKNTADFNTILNKWKNKFIDSIIRDVTAGQGDDDGVGGGGLEIPVIGTNIGKGSKGKPSEKGGTKGGSESRKSQAKPSVLISSHDEDPLKSDGASLVLSDRHPSIYQRGDDVIFGLYWINTSKPLANLILDKKGPDSPEWRSYIFNRYIDIIVKETIYSLDKKQLDLNVDIINNKIDDIISQVHDKAASDLQEFLLDDKYII
jgi:hypothetical protein